MLGWGGMCGTNYGYRYTILMLGWGGMVGPTTDIDIQY